jgi:hypothetical protein
MGIYVSCKHNSRKYQSGCSGEERHNVSSLRAQLPSVSLLAMKSGFNGVFRETYKACLSNTTQVGVLLSLIAILGRAVITFFADSTALGVAP